MAASHRGPWPPGRAVHLVPVVVARHQHSPSPAADGARVGDYMSHGRAAGRI